MTTLNTFAKSVFDETWEFDFSMCHGGPYFYCRYNVNRCRIGA